MSVFDALVGQAEVSAGLARAAAGDGMTSSWLFVGAAGSGRSVAARAFAAALQCTAAEESLGLTGPGGLPAPAPGCGACAACTTVLAGTHADLRLLRPEGVAIGVDEARDLVLQAAMRPSTGRWRVLLVEDADRLTESAANALLKALEEPAARTVFLLCAPAADDVLPTIRSRCRTVRLRLPGSRDVAAVLESEGIDSSIAAFAARAAQGHVGRARRLATDEQARVRRAEVLEIPSRLRSLGETLAAAADLVETAEQEAARLTGERDTVETAELRATLSATSGARRAISLRGSAGAVKELEKRQKSRGKRAVLDAVDRALVDLTAWYRDVLAEQLGAFDRAGIDRINDDQRREIETEAAASCAEQTLRRIDAILTCRRLLEESPYVSTLLALEALVLELRTA